MQNWISNIFDIDPRVAAINPKANDGSVDLTFSIGFKEREGEDRYVIQAHGSPDSFQLGIGYPVWYRRLSHIAPLAIKKSIPFTIRLESLKGQEPDLSPCPKSQTVKWES